MQLDSFTRRYLIGLGLIAGIALVAWLLSLDSRVRDLNALLEDDALVGSYPYQFDVLKLENGVARMHTPRSAELSVIQGLRILYPELKGKTAVSPEMEAAQKELARVQARAMTLVLNHADVTHVVWVLDEPWLNRHGVFVQ